MATADHAAAVGAAQAATTPKANSTTKAKTPAAKKSTATGSSATNAANPAGGQVQQPDAVGSFDEPAAGVDLVQPESLGDVVKLVPAKFGRKNLSIAVTPPAAPGKYRLTITLHDSDGVAFDPPTQAMLPGLIVRVTGDFDGAVLADPTATLTAGSSVALPVRVENLGTVSWGMPGVVVSDPAAADDAVPTQPAQVVAQWVPLSAGAALPADASAEGHADLPIGLKGGATVDASIDLTVPTAPGSYLLLLDVVTPDRGSLTASGWQPTLIRVTVTAP